MKARRFHVQDAGSGFVVADDGGTTWATVPRRMADAEASAALLLDVARKSYSLGVSDGYAGTGRAFYVRKAGDGGAGRTWDLMSMAHPEGARRVASRPRAGFRILPDPAPGLMREVAVRTHAAGLADGRGQGPARGAGPAPADFWN